MISLLKSRERVEQACIDDIMLHPLCSWMASLQRRGIETLLHLFSNCSTRLRECLTRNVKCEVPQKTVEDLKSLTQMAPRHLFVTSNHLQVSQLTSDARVNKLTVAESPCVQTGFSHLAPINITSQKFSTVSMQLGFSLQITTESFTS